MPPLAYRCPNCSAPLPVAAPGAGVTCAHCGTQSRLPQGEHGGDAPTILVAGPDPDAPSGSGSWLGLIVLVGTPVVLVCGSIFLFGVLPDLIGGRTIRGFEVEPRDLNERAHEAALEASEEAVEQSREASEARGISRSQLADHIPRGWTPFAERPPGVDLAAMDPVVVLPWAREVARAWSPDAELYRVDIRHIPHSGRLDVVNDEQASLGLRFYSPKRRQAADALREVSEEAVVTGISIQFDDGGIEIGPGGGPRDLDDFTPLTEDLCPMPRVMQAAAERRQAHKRPFYDIDLRVRTPYAGLPSWVWDRDAAGGYVFPDTCEPWSLALARKRAR